MDNALVKKDRPDRRDDGAGYDTTRVHVAGTFIFLAAFALSLVTIACAVGAYQAYLQQPLHANDQAYALESVHLPQPLQPSAGHPVLPWEDMAALRAKQEQWLHSAGNLPGQIGRQHIPIEQAMDRLLQSGILKQPWKNPTSQPYVRPANEQPRIPSVENRT